MPRSGTLPRPAACPVCTTVHHSARLELDLMMADPARWPAAMWGIFDQPKGDLPPAMREWGAIEVGQEWLREHGFSDLTKPDVRLHYERHVPLVATNADELVANGLIAAGEAAEVPDARVDPLAYLRYLSAGIDVGRTGLRLLEAHVAQLQKDNKEVPINLIKLMVDTGAKLAINQAGIVSRQKSQPTIEPDDEDDAFRGAGGRPGPRIGHHRIRKVDGESRPVRDTGPKDRAHYNARADQEGGTKL